MIHTHFSPTFKDSLTVRQRDLARGLEQTIASSLPLPVREDRGEGATPILDQSTNVLLGFHDSEPDHLASSEKPIAIFGDHTCKMQLLIEPFSVGPNVVPFVAGQELPTAYVFYAVNSLVQTQEYKRHWIPLNAKEIVVADPVTAQHFASLIQPILVAQETLGKAIRNLRRTRDLLVPRLLSGQVNLAEN